MDYYSWVSPRVAYPYREWLAYPYREWHEDIGPVLWWTFPVREPPYCGTPLDEGWPFDPVEDHPTLSWTCPIVPNGVLAGPMPRFLGRE